MDIHWYKLIQLGSLSCLISMLLACSHPLEVVGEGTIFSESGTRRCSTETSPCENIVANDYLETYTARPSKSNQFAGWSNYCQVFSKQCSFNIPSSVVHDNWGKEFLPLIAKFEPLGTNGIWDLGLGNLHSSTWYGKGNIAGTGPRSRATAMSVGGKGDVNNDGMDDLVFGAPFANGATGEVYVVFGGRPGHRSGNLGHMNDGVGLTIRNSDSDLYGLVLGYSVDITADVNADGVNDILIGAPNYVTPGGACGNAYVVFGSDGIGDNGDIDLAALMPGQGFTINGGRCRFDGLLGASVSSAGDFNNDGIDDFLLAMPTAHGPFIEETNSLRYASGRVYLLFGSENIGSSGTLDLNELETSGGIAIWGSDNNERVGTNIDGGCDVNADGIDDIIISAPGLSTPYVVSGLPTSYIIYGTESPFNHPTQLLEDLADSQRLSIEGGRSFSNAFQQLSSTVFVGDVNGDGICDFNVDEYVVFGHSSLANYGSINIANLDPSEAFRVEGGDGRTSAGDFNNDGIGDLLIGSPTAAVRGGLPQGAAYVVYGKAEGNSKDVNPNVLDTDDGLVLIGDQPDDEMGSAIAGVGDTNDDGIDDILVVSQHALSFQGHVKIVHGGLVSP